MNIKSRHFNINFSPIKSVKSLIFNKNVLSFDNSYYIFVSNKTRHASHQNSAPGWVFDFNGGDVL